MDNKKIVLISLVGSGVLLWFILKSILTYFVDYFQLLALFRWAEAMVVALPIILAVMAVVVCLRHPLVNEFLIDVVIELKKVTWPLKKEIYASTIVVIIIVLIVSLLLGFFDAIWSFVIEKVI